MRDPPFFECRGVGGVHTISLRALRALRSNRYGESVTKRCAPAPRPSRFAATEIAATGYRPPRRESGGIPPVACLQCWQQIRVRVGHAAQSDDAPAMSGFALGAKRFVKTAHRSFAGKPDASSRGMAYPYADLPAR